MKITETNLVKQLKKKNSKDLDFLVNNYSNLLYKVIYNVLNSYGEKGLKDANTGTDKEIELNLDK